MSVKIALDAGHCLTTLGKRCDKNVDPNKTSEWWLNNRIATYMEDELKNYDAEVMRVDDVTGKKDISHSARCKAANTFGADIYFSIHHNAANKLFAGGGIVVYVWKKADAQLLEWQKIVYDNLIAETCLKGNRATPLGKANFDVLVKSNAQAILVEHGFMNSTVDTPIILTDEFARKCAKANVKSLVEIFGLKEKEPKKETSGFKQYMIKVIKTPLNIRSGPGTNYPIVAKIQQYGTYTIVAEGKANSTKYPFGKLKSGVGWVSLSPSYVKKI